MCAAADGQLSCSAFLCFLSVFFRSVCGCVFIVLGVLKVCALRSLCVIGLCVAVGWATIATLLTFSLCLSRGLMGVWPDVMTQTLRVLQVHTEAVSVTLLCQTHFCFSEYSHTYSNVCLIHFTVSKSINHAKKTQHDDNRETHEFDSFTGSVSHLSPCTFLFSSLYCVLEKDGTETVDNVTCVCGEREVT